MDTITQDIVARLNERFRKGVFFTLLSPKLMAVINPYDHFYMSEAVEDPDAQSLVQVAQWGEDQHRNKVEEKTALDTCFNQIYGGFYHNINILMNGQSGSGKSYASRRILNHFLNASRHDQPDLDNMTYMNEELKQTFLGASKMINFIGGAPIEASQNSNRYLGVYELFVNRHTRLVEGGRFQALMLERSRLIYSQEKGGAYIALFILYVAFQEEDFWREHLSDELCEFLLDNPPIFIEDCFDYSLGEPLDTFKEFISALEQIGITRQDENDATEQDLFSDLINTLFGIISLMAFDFGMNQDETSEDDYVSESFLQDNKWIETTKLLGLKSEDVEEVIFSRKISAQSRTSVYETKIPLKHALNYKQILVTEAYSILMEWVLKKINKRLMQYMPEVEDYRPTTKRRLFSEISFNRVESKDSMGDEEQEKQDDETNQTSQVRSRGRKPRRTSSIINGDVLLNDLKANNNIIHSPDEIVMERLNRASSVESTDRAERLISIEGLQESDLNTYDSESTHSFFSWQNSRKYTSNNYLLVRIIDPIGFEDLGDNNGVLQLCANYANEVFHCLGTLTLGVDKERRLFEEFEDIEATKLFISSNQYENLPWCLASDIDHVDNESGIHKRSQTSISLQDTIKQLEKKDDRTLSNNGVNNDLTQQFEKDPRSDLLECITLYEAKKGIFELLSLQSRLITTVGSNSAFLSALNNEWSDTPCFRTPRFSTDINFVVRHYCGEVTYTIREMAEENFESIHRTYANIPKLIGSSTRKSLSGMSGNTRRSMNTDDMIVDNEEALSGSFMYCERVADDISHLTLALLESANSAFIYDIYFQCFPANSSNEEMSLDRAYLTTLVELEDLPNLYIIQGGLFPFQYKFKDFINHFKDHFIHLRFMCDRLERNKILNDKIKEERYRKICIDFLAMIIDFMRTNQSKMDEDLVESYLNESTTSVGDSPIRNRGGRRRSGSTGRSRGRARSVSCEEITMDVIRLRNKVEYLIGKKKIFITERINELLTKSRTLKWFSAAIIIQNKFKIWKYHKFVNLIIKLQSTFRMLLNRMRLRHSIKCVTKIQALWRRAIARVRFKVILRNRDEIIQLGNSKFLEANERIVFTGLVLKKGKQKLSGFKRRMLILTSKPRLVYIDPAKKVVKGEIPWGYNSKLRVIDDSRFEIETPKRTYRLTTLLLPDAFDWETALMNHDSFLIMRISSVSSESISKRASDPFASTEVRARSGTTLMQASWTKSGRKNPYLQVIKQGYVLKKSTGLLQTWNKRYFVLISEGLFYFRSPNDTIPGGEIPLSGSLMISTSKRKKFGLNIRYMIDGNPETLHLAFRDEEDRSQWKAAIKLMAPNCLEH